MAWEGWLGLLERCGMPGKKVANEEGEGAVGLDKTGAEDLVDLDCDKWSKDPECRMLCRKFLLTAAAVRSAGAASGMKVDPGASGVGPGSSGAKEEGEGAVGLDKTGAEDLVDFDWDKWSKDPVCRMYCRDFLLMAEAVRSAGAASGMKVEKGKAADQGSSVVEKGNAADQGSSVVEKGKAADQGETKSDE